MHVVDAERIFAALAPDPGVDPVDHGDGRHLAAGAMLQYIVSAPKRVESQAAQEAEIAGRHPCGGGFDRDQGFWTWGMVSAAVWIEEKPEAEKRPQAVAQDPYRSG